MALAGTAPFVLTVDLSSRCFDDQLLVSDSHVEPLLHFADFVKSVENGRVFRSGKIKKSVFRIV